MLIEAEQCSQPRPDECLAGTSQPIAMQTAKIDALLEIYLHVARRWQRPVPAVPRINFLRWYDDGVVRFSLRHGVSSAWVGALHDTIAPISSGHGVHWAPGRSVRFSPRWWHMR